MSVLSLEDAARHPLVRRPDGTFPSLATVRRWISRGCSGRRLEVLRIGRTPVVTPESLARFVGATADAPSSNLGEG